MFKPGKSGNPAGRGHTPSKLTAKAREQAFRALELSSRWPDDVFSQWLKDNPAVLNTLMGKAMVEHSKIEGDVKISNPIAESLERLSKKLEP